MLMEVLLAITVFAVVVAIIIGFCIFSFSLYFLYFFVLNELFLFSIFWDQSLTL